MKESNPPKNSLWVVATGKMSWHTASGKSCLWEELQFFHSPPWMFLRHKPWDPSSRASSVQASCFPQRSWEFPRVMLRQATADLCAYLHACNHLTKISACCLASLQLSQGLSCAPAPSQWQQRCQFEIIRAISLSLIKGPELKLTVISHKQLC